MMPSPAPTAHPSAWLSLIKLFFAPAGAFRELAGHWRWGPAYWLMVLTGIPFWIVELRNKMAMVDHQLWHLQSEGALLPGTAEGMKIGAAAGTVISALLTPLFTCLFLALLVWVAEWFSYKKLGFSRLFSLSVWSTLPPLAVRQVVALPLALYGVTFRSDLSLFFPPGALAESAALAAAVRSVDLFIVWNLVLLGMGLRYLRQTPPLAVSITVAWVFLASGLTNVLIASLL